MVNIQRSAKEYDVCIVGSGAGGGMAAHVLTEAGADVVMLEAGPAWTVEEDGAMFTWNYESPRRGARTTKRPGGEFDGALGGWEIEGEPYLVEEGAGFNWFRARMLGGRTNHWTRISQRFGPDDFRGRSRDGYGEDWPISYEDLKPYYDSVDRLIGVFGANVDFYNTPDGFFLPPPEPRCYEQLFKSGCEKLNIPAVPSRVSILTESLHGRPACHYCAQCNRGCTTHSNFSSGPVLIDPARQGGRLELITNAMVREVTTDAEGRATGVSYIDTETRVEQKVRADVVVLAASACESARLLLNSTSRRHPNGLANSSGVVGKYLMDTPGGSVAGLLPQLVDAPAHNCDGTGALHLYSPWWLHDEHDRLDFPRGYHLEVWGGRSMPGYGFMNGVEGYNSFSSEAAQGGERRAGGYGKALKNDYRRLYGAAVNVGGRGEMIGRESNYCEIAPDTLDQYGIPVLRFNIKWSDVELRQAKHMQETAREVLEAMGATPLREERGEEEDYGLWTPGSLQHEVGVTRMGKDPARSVLNEHCQAHDVDNLFVADAGPFVSNPNKHPTWTILALSMRTSEYIVDQREKGNV